MRVLWFTNNPCKFQFVGRVNYYNAGGWMVALQEELMLRDEIELGISFFADGLPSEVKQETVVYFPIPLPKKSLKDKIKGYSCFRKLSVEESFWSEYIEKFTKIINYFNPDIIQIFGSEKYMGLAALASQKPLILHIQGILNPCDIAYFPPGISSRDFYFLDYNPIHVFKRFYSHLWWKRDCYRERFILKNVKNFIGRTDWDRSVTKILSPNSNYYFGEEIMRAPFYTPLERKLPKNLVINTVISAPYYKGFDIILKSANILKNEMGLEFEWNVYGNVNPMLAEKALKLSHKDLNVFLRGVVDAETIREAHANATVYVHSSYIENGCNAIIEAQMCSCTPIANYVGGLNNTIKHEKTGYLVPANDPYQTAYIINYLYNNPSKNIDIGQNASKDAFLRHNKVCIVNNLINTYKDIIEG